MKQRRIISVLLIMTLLAALFAGSFSAAAANKNTGKRHELCEALSTQAVAYYTGSNTWEHLSALDGKTTTSSVEACGSPLFNALHNLMWNTLTNTVSYKSLTSYWKDTDASNGSNDASLIYCDEISSSYNREHVWPKSHGNFYESGAGSDLHHLRPSDSTINSTRGHWTFGNTKELLSSYSTKSYGGKTVLWYDTKFSQNNCLGIVEVNDNVKGDVARILLYVYVTYGKSTGENLNLFTKTSASGSGNNANTGDKIIYDLDTLLEWCENDPVDTWEMSRNDCCASVQGNRNVFIDYPEFAWLLFNQEVPDMDTPSGMAHELQGGTSYTITAVSANETMGTVSGSGRSFTATPKDGYYVSGYTLVPEDAATVTQNGNSFSLSKPTADCTLTVTFAEKTPVTVQFSVPSGVSCEDISGYAGEELLLPTPIGTPTGEYTYSFKGWVSAEVDNATDKPTTVYSAGGSYTPSGNDRLYALYTYSVGGSGSSTTFAKISEQSELTDGATYVFTSSSTGKAMSTQVGGNWVYPGGTYTGDTIEAPAATDVWTVSEGIISCDGGSLTSTGAKSVSLSTEGSVWNIQPVEGEWTIAANSTILCFNSTGWRPYGGSGYGSDKTFQIYKAGSGGTTYYTTVIGAACTHDYQAVVTAATCTEGGYTTYTCALCQDSYVAEQTAALGHDFVDGTCTRCGEADPDYVPPVIDPCKDYTDIDRTAWYHAAADFVIENGYMGSTGTDTLTFEPKTECTRSMIVTILYSLAGKPAVTFEEKFPDVKDGQWYTNAVMWAYQNGVVSGYDTGLFGTNDKITREQLAVIFKAYAEKVAEQDTANSADLSGFPDANKVTWSKSAVAWAVAEGLISGKGVNGQTLLDPQGKATRAEAAVILMKFLSNS